MRLPSPSTWLLLCLPFSVSCLWTTRSHAHGAYHDVVTQITRELEKTPDDAALHFKLACAHQEHGEWTLTMAEVERVERLAPGKFQTAFVQGQALASGGHWQAAKSVLDGFIATEPNHSLALAQRAKVLIKLEQSDAALADYRAALEKARADGAHMTAPGV
eukprot:gene3361-4180_t